MIIRKVVYFALLWVFSLTALSQFSEIERKFKSKPQTEETILWLTDTAFSFVGNNAMLTKQLALLALERAEEIGTDLGKVKSYNVIGVSFHALGKYDEALEYYIRGLELSDKIENPRVKAIININVARIYNNLNRTDKAKDYLINSLAPLQAAGDTLNLGRSYGNLGRIYSNLGNKDSAIYYYNEALSIRMARSDSVGIANVFYNMALSYSEISSDPKLEPVRADVLQAYKYLTEARKFIKEGKRDVLLSKIYIFQGKTLSELGRDEEAISYLTKGLDLSILIESKTAQQEAFIHLTQFYIKKGDYKTAFDYSTEESRLDKELRSADVSKQIDRLNIKYETAQKEKKLAELAQRSAIDRGIRNVSIVGVLAILVIAALFVAYMAQKKRKDMLASQLKVRMLADEINEKNKEITAYTVNFLQKTQLMEELKVRINEMKKTSDISTNKELTRFNRIVENTFRSDEEWKTFEVTFNQMHDDFFTELKNAYPDISNAELKLCALLRLNMNLKESAKMLGIAPDSVKTARYRLRKKLKLKTEDNLIDFLLQFEKNYMKKKPKS